jgi:hypothetical protein
MSKLNRTLSEQEFCRVRERALAGERWEKIAKDLGITNVKQLRRETVRETDAFDSESVEAVVKNRYQAGEPLAAIAPDYKMTPRTLWGALKEIGVIPKGSKFPRSPVPSHVAKAAAAQAAKIQAAANASAAQMQPQPAATSSPEPDAADVQPEPVTQPPGLPADGFIPPKWFRKLQAAIKHKKGACMFGPRGSGKSTAVRYLAKSMNVPTITMQCAANEQIDALVGEKGVVNDNGCPVTKFVDGPLTTAMRNGCWLIAEEPNVMHPGVWSKVNNILDDTGEGLRLPTGEVIPQHPNFRLVLCYNDGYTGTKEVNAALKDRCPPLHCDYFEPDREAELLAIATGAPLNVCAKVVSVATMIRQAPSLRFDLSPRPLTYWIKMALDGMSWSEGFDAAIMDLLGDPTGAAVQRKVVATIAVNAGIDQWPLPAPLGGETAKA